MSRPPRVSRACPNCGDAPVTAQHLREHPECAAVVQQLCALYRVSRRVAATPGPGRPPGSRNKPKA